MTALKFVYLFLTIGNLDNSVIPDNPVKLSFFMLIFVAILSKIGSICKICEKYGWLSQLLLLLSVI